MMTNSDETPQAGPAASAADDGLARLGGVPADAAVLVSGPPMTGKEELLLAVLARHADSAVLISTKHGPDRIRERYRTHAGEIEDDRIGVVDCVSYHGLDDTVEERARVGRVESPENLTRIGVKFTELFELYHDDPGSGHVGVGVCSLSNLLMHSDVKNVYQFLQVLTGQVRSAGWLLVATVNDSAVDIQDLQTIQQHFDGHLQTRENDAGQREYRVRGFGAPASDWIAF